MGKTNAKGRSKNGPSFIRLHRGITNSQAWRELSPHSMKLLLAIWERHNGQNNGFIGFSHREAKECLKTGTTQVARAFQELQEKGFLVGHHKGHFDTKAKAGNGRSSEWELTMEASGGQPPKLYYREWPQKKYTAPGERADGSRSESREASKSPKLVQSAPNAGADIIKLRG